MNNYTPEQLEFLKAHQKLPRRELTDRFNTRFQCNRTVGAIRQACCRRGWIGNLNGIFKPGHTPWNKGKKTGLIPKNCFKKGNISANTKKVLTERIDKDGYIVIKAETGMFKWRSKNRWLWEKHHGKLKPNQVVRFKDGNKLNCTIENLYVVTQAENLMLNKLEYNSAPEEIKPVIKATAQLFSKTRKLINTIKSNSLS